LRFDGLLIQGLIAGVVAVLLAITAQSLRPHETDFVISNVRLIAALAAVPAVWMIVQALPLRSLAHPIWLSAETAAGIPIAGAISIDPGASIVALGRYLSLSALAFISVAVAVDRQRAEWILFALTAAGTTTALVVLFTALHASDEGWRGAAGTDAIDGAAIGAVIAAGACVRTIERYETRRSNSQRTVPFLAGTFTACAMGLVLCGGAVVVGGSWRAAFALACGLATFLAVMLVRRFALSAWGTAAITLPAIGIAFLLAISQQVPAHDPNLTLRFAADPAAIPVTQRVLDELRLVGTGAGTFNALASIYRGVEDPSAGSLAAPAAARLAVELGQPMLWLIILAAGIIVVVLLRASLRRGRDSFYAAVGASCVVTWFVLAFVNPGVLGTTTGLMLAAALGLALAQKQSRSARQ
jgi:hypothetical protein